jgi:uncharacterized protein
MSRELDTWYSLPDLDRLARLGKALEGEIALLRLTRLATLLSSTDGSVNATCLLQAGTDETLQLDLHCSADIELICQRCLEPMQLTLTSSASLLVAESESAALQNLNDLELLILDGNRFNPRLLIEDELIVSLPLVAMHQDRSDCGSLARELEKLSNEDGDGPGAVPVNH